MFPHAIAIQSVVNNPEKYRIRYSLGLSYGFIDVGKFEPLQRVSNADTIAMPWRHAKRPGVSFTNMV